MKILRSNKILTLAVMLSLCVLISQGSGTHAFRSYDIEFGLSNMTVRDIAEDKYGFLWVATDEGLNRICGSQVMRYYKSVGSNGLSGNELNALLDDPERSTMWIGTQRDGLLALNYDTGEFSVYKNGGSHTSIITNDVTDIAPDGNGNLWVATYSNGIDHLDVTSGEFSHHRVENVAGLVSNEFWCVEYDPESGNVYGGHVGDGFSVIDPVAMTATNHTEASGVPVKVVWDMVMDGEYVWLSTDVGLCRFNTVTQETERFPYRGMATDSRSVIDVGKELIVAIDDVGVLAFDKSSCAFTTLTPGYLSRPEDHHDVISRSKPNRLYADSNGNIIVGTLHEGLSAFKKDVSGFLALNSVSGSDVDKTLPPFPDVRSIAVTGSSDIWLGTNGNGLLGKKTLMPDEDHIMSVVSDAIGRLWCAGRDGDLLSYNPADGETRRYAAGLPGGNPVCLASRGDTLWIGCEEGVYRFDIDKGVKTARHDVERNFITCLEPDASGCLWVGSLGNGASVLDSSGRIIRSYDKEHGFTSNTVNDICINGKDVWLATGEGVVRIDPKNPDRHMVEADSQRNVKSVVADRRGNVWYTTENGIGVVRKDGGKLFFDSGLPMLGFNNGSVATDRQGRIYFGAAHGVVTFNPDHILSGDWLPVPVVSAFTVHGDAGDTDLSLSICKDRRVKLSYRQNNFTVAVNPSDVFPGKGDFEYRLKGLEDKWYSMGDGNTVTFRELPYGKYVFEVRNAGYDNAGKTAKMDIEIMPPLWLQWWAKVIYVVVAAALAGVGFSAYMRRVRRKAEKSMEAEKLAGKRELDEERLKFFTNVTHELRTPLTLITGPLEDMMRESSLSGSDRWKIEVIHKNARRLLGLVNQLLDFRKAETNNRRLCVCRGNVTRAVKDIAMKYVELNRNPDVSITVTSATDDIRMYFDREVLTIILDNLISNAMKYTEAGMISVSVNPEQQGGRRLVRISVKDTGQGIGQDALPHVFERYYQEKNSKQASGTGIGLALVKALVDLHCGEISVESAREVGTCFSVLLDRDMDYPEALHTECAAADDGSADNRDVEHADGVRDTDHAMVLVVEDNPDILEYVEQSLSGIFDVKTASNGRDGLEIARESLPDVVVTDIMMPVMDGMEMTGHLKSDVATSHIPVVMLTALDSAADRERGYGLGVDSYLTKPFSGSLLISRVNNILSRRHMLAEYLRKESGVPVQVQPSESDAGVKTSSGAASGGTDLAAESERLRMALGRLDKEFLEKLDNAILQDAGTGKVNIDYLTDVMCMSRATLYRKMKALTGMSANEYIRQIKMRRAKELMLDGGMTLSEIACELGFSSLSYFRESFKAIYGQSPTDYLRQLKNGG